jgi:hypothetical protein
MAGSPLDDVTSAVKDAAYVSVGLGVIAFQRLQVRRNELTKSLSGSTGEARGVLESVGNLVGDRVKLVEERLEAAREQLTGQRTTS